MSCLKLHGLLQIDENYNKKKLEIYLISLDFRDKKKEYDLIFIFYNYVCITINIFNS